MKTSSIPLVLGDRIKVKELGFAGTKSLRGKLGTVIVLREESNAHTIGVQFDNPYSGGHNCEGFAPNFPIFKNGYCRWGHHDEVEFIEHGPPIEPVRYDTKRSEKWGGKSDADEDE